MKAVASSHTATSAKRFRVQGDGAGQEQEGEAGGASVRDGEMRGLYLSAPRKYEAPAAAEPKRQLPWPAHAMARGQRQGGRARSAGGAR